jgi:hypothetical protein
VKGDIFLNTSLTEAFCMAIVEAASCGLSVVSTAVGGIHEVLPEQFIYCVQPSVGSIQAGLERAVEDVITGYRPDHWEGNIFVSAAYNWRDVAARTEAVYKAVWACGARKGPGWPPGSGTCGRRAPWQGPSWPCFYLFCYYFILLLDNCSHTD